MYPALCYWASVQILRKISRRLLLGAFFGSHCHCNVTHLSAAQKECEAAPLYAKIN